MFGQYFSVTDGSDLFGFLLGLLKIMVVYGSDGAHSVFGLWAGLLAGLIVDGVELHWLWSCTI